MVLGPTRSWDSSIFAGRWLMLDALIRNVLPLSRREIDNVRPAARALRAAQSAAQCRADCLLGRRQQQQRAENVGEKPRNDQQEPAEHRQEAVPIELDPADRALAERGSHTLHVTRASVADDRHTGK